MDQDLSLWGLAFEVAIKKAGNPGVSCPCGKPVADDRLRSRPNLRYLCLLLFKFSFHLLSLSFRSRLDFGLFLFSSSW
jgi:hypothetical protein